MRTPAGRLLYGANWDQLLRSVARMQVSHAGRSRRISAVASSETAAAIMSYHERTKHSLQKYAAGPGRLDWNSQPDPFRRYKDCTLVNLDLTFDDQAGPSFQDLTTQGVSPPCTRDAHSLSSFLYYSMALSAWKQFGTSRWSLRVNPSSGNLHPTEAYIVSAPIQGISNKPFVAHYAPKEHGLELRGIIPAPAWTALCKELAVEPLFLVGLSSVFWREAWKYGERAYRYCNHDVGHAIAALAVSASLCGWRLVLLDGLSQSQVAALLGLTRHPPPHQQGQEEAEHPDCLLAVLPCDAGDESAMKALHNRMVDDVAWQLACSQATTLKAAARTEQLLHQKQQRQQSSSKRATEQQQHGSRAATTRPERQQLPGASAAHRRVNAGARPRPTQAPRRGSTKGGGPASLFVLFSFVCFVPLLL